MSTAEPQEKVQRSMSVEAGDENILAFPRVGRSLADTGLSSEAAEVGQTLVSSLIGPLERRTMAVFLGRQDFDRVEYPFGELMGTLMLETLSRFAHERGGEIVLATVLGEKGEVLHPTQETVEVDGKTRQFMRYGHMFIHFPKERVVVSVEDDRYGLQSRVLIRVHSNRDSNAFLLYWVAYARDHNYLRGRAFFADGEVIERGHHYSWEDIYLPEGTKRTIQTHVQCFLANLGRLKEFGVKTRRGIILAGPPGTGKTLVGKVLAATVDASFIWVSPRHVEDAASFKDILEIAQFVAPAVLFFEDLDLFAEDRRSRGDTRLGELLNQLDGAVDNNGIIAIATTNRLDVIEKALRNRPGRFDRVIEFEEMEEPCRRQMLKSLLEKTRIVTEDLDYLVQATKGYTGAQVEEVANTVYILGLDTYNNSLGSGQNSAESACISVTRELLDRALAEVNVERKGRLGFRVA